MWHGHCSTWRSELRVNSLLCFHNSYPKPSLTSLFSVFPLAVLVGDKEGGNVDGTCADLCARHPSHGSGDGKSQGFVH